MQNRVIAFIEKHLTIIVGITIVWVIISPFLFTHFSILNFSDTGQIGDTIGGITAPAIGILSAILLYLTLTKQIESNNAMVYESNFRITYNEILSFKSAVKDSKFFSKSGEEAIRLFPSQVPVSLSIGHTTGLYNEIVNYDNLFNGFHRLFYLFDTLKTNDVYSDFIKKEITNLYFLTFQEPCLEILVNWNVSKSDVGISDIKGRMYMLKQNLDIIHNTIGKKYKSDPIEIK